MKKGLFFSAVGLLFSLLMLISVITAKSQTKVVLPGTFQSELGCTNEWGGDWEPSCNATALTFNPGTGMWEGSFMIQAGCWAYKVAYDNAWNENYGLYGWRDGPNIPLYVPTAGMITFVYDPVTHIVTSTPYPSGTLCQPNTVVIPGSFQSELGCTNAWGGDWEPTCDATRLTYNVTSGMWEGTFNLPAGSWEYKVVINDSWGENYGMYGVPGGANIPLELCTPARITFIYDHTTHLVTLKAESTGICITKFYDANVNGVVDYGEALMQGVAFTLGGDATAEQYTDVNGSTTFGNLVPGNYTVTETVPSGYYTTTPVSKNIELNTPVQMQVGNVCLGAGGGHGIGFWMSKNGQQVINDNGGPESELMDLRFMYLRNADGSDFDPWTYAELKEWMKNGNATNMAYMLSVQMAAMYLNLEAGYVNWGAIVYTPQCGSLGEGQFSYVWYLYYQTYYNLWFNSLTTAGNPERMYQEALKNAFDKANNNMSFVQSVPCGTVTAPVNRIRPEENLLNSSTRIWPNPSSGSFNIRLQSATMASMQVKVYDATGRMVMSFSGTTNKEYQFGETLKPGLYIVELTSGDQRSTQKIIRQ
ncbi:MAG: T9SS type A sorting domain-containing protein [Chitinophagaceae bacterium]